MISLEDFKYSLVDPSLILEDELLTDGYSLLPYVHSVFNVAKLMFDYILDDNVSDRINQILQMEGITDEILLDMVNKDVYRAYYDINMMINGDICELVDQYTEHVDEYIIECRERYGDMLKGIEINTDKMTDEIMTYYYSKRIYNISRESVYQFATYVAIIMEYTSKRILGETEESPPIEEVIDMGNKKRMTVDFGRRINNSIRDGVNDLDKMFQCDLTNPEITLDTSKDFHKYVKEHKKHILDILNEINDSGKKLKKSDSIKIKGSFQKRSKWFQKEDSRIHGETFQVRFILYLLAWVYNNLEEISDCCFVLNDDSEWVEYEEKGEYSDTIVDRTEDFVHRVLNRQPLSEHLQYFMELNTCIDQVASPKKIIKKVDEMYYQSSYLMDMIGRKEDREIMETLLSLGYMYVVHNPKIKRPIHISDYRFGNGDTEDILRRFGKRLIEAGDEDGWNIIFRFFIESNPKVYTDFYNVNHDKYLYAAVLALYFVVFISGDSRVERLVNKIV